MPRMDWYILLKNEDEVRLRHVGLEASSIP
jgi:hypothetical protein